MKLVLKICGGDWKNASRDKRELSVYKELGYDVAVLAKGYTKDKGRVEFVDGYKVYRYSTRPLGRIVPNSINRLISILLWAKYVRELRPSIISGHDLVPGLTIGWLSTICNKNRARLIYDSHEFELGKNTTRNKIEVLIIKFWERFLISRSVFSIFVNESIKEEINRIHKGNYPSIVIRSTPNYWEIDDSVCTEMRKEVLDMFEDNK